MGRLAGKSLPKSHGWIAKTGPAVNKDIRPQIKRLNPDLRADGIMLVAQKALTRARTSLLFKLSAESLGGEVCWGRSNPITNNCIDQGGVPTDRP
jgi:hypothetical protein